MGGLKERQSEAGIMKQFIIDLITVKSHSNHLGANRVILSILPGKKQAMKMLKSGKDKDGFVTEQTRSVCLFIYLLTFLPGLLSLTFKLKVHWRHSGIFWVQFGHLKHQ